jgi:hypothetical protein
MPLVCFILEPFIVHSFSRFFAVMRGLSLHRCHLTVSIRRPQCLGSPLSRRARSARQRPGRRSLRAQHLIARRAATLAVWCEQEEAVLAGGGKFNIGEYTTAANSLRRLLADLGLERRMKDITPSVDAYLRGNA